MYNMKKLFWIFIIYIHQSHIFLRKNYAEIFTIIAFLNFQSILSILDLLVNIINIKHSMVHIVKNL